MNNMITAKNLKKKYGSLTALNIPDLTIHMGQSFGLVGNNGAGKTTFFSLVLDIIEASEGEVHSNGSRVKQSAHWQLYTGAYLDERFLIRFLTPEEYLDFVRRSYHLSSGDLQLFLDRFSDFFNGEVLGKKKYIRELSKGNQKKLGIAASMMSYPKVLVLDEPFPHLDPTSVIRLKEILKDMKEANRTTMLISSHDLNHVTEVCDRIAILEQGLIIEDRMTDETTLEKLESYFNLQR